MAHGLQKFAPDKYTCEILYPGEIDEKVAAKYDAVCTFSWAEANHRIAEVTRHVSLLASHSFEQSPWKSTINSWPPDWKEEHWRGCTSSRLSNKWTAAKALPNFHGLIAVNPALQASASLIKGVKEITYLPAGLDLLDWRWVKPRAPGDKLRVGWCGQFDSMKPDPKGVVWVLDPVREKMEDTVDFVLNMRTPQKALSAPQMRNWYREVDVLLITSITEGTPMTGLEAMAMGRPVVSTGVGDMCKMVVTGHTGAQVPCYTNEQQANRATAEICYWLDKLNKDRRLVAEMGQNASDMVRSCRGWHMLASQWLEFIAGDHDDSDKKE